MDDLAQHNHLVRIDDEVDPYLEMAEVQRRVFHAGGPALYFSRVKGTTFPMVSNLFGTLERARFIFRDTYRLVEKLIALKAGPEALMRSPLSYVPAFFAALGAFPRKVRSGAVLESTTTLSALPHLTSWPLDGGPFITLPIVYSEDPKAPGLNKSNLGMYRIQLAGNEYVRDQQVGLHYQIQRGIGVHHQHALELGQPLKVNIFVGGPPAMTLSAVMPLPEGLSELRFAGVLGGRRVKMARSPLDGLPLWADADFCLCGTIDPTQTLPEGPFGDHLGYYSLKHAYPVLNVHKVFHRRDAIWPFTVVGRPPQEDTIFGELIHELTGAAIPAVLPGVEAVHAVDATGVHPLLLAIGSERYQPFQKPNAPQELLTQANAILGQGQLSLAKYLLIASKQSEPPPIGDVAAFLKHVLERLDFRRDVHFYTKTTIDTLDYSGEGVNQGSKVVMAATGARVRTLANSLPVFGSLPEGFVAPRLALDGVCVVQGPRYEDNERARQHIQSLLGAMGVQPGLAWVVLVDDSEFASRTLNNFLWTTFTCSDPARDIEGVDASIQDKHWGCRGPLVIDARFKPWQAPALVEDADVTRRVDVLFKKWSASGGPLYGRG